MLRQIGGVACRQILMGLGAQVNEVVSLNHKFAEALDTLQHAQQHNNSLQDEIETLKECPSSLLAQHISYCCDI